MPTALTLVLHVVLAATAAQQNDVLPQAHAPQQANVPSKTVHLTPIPHYKADLGVDLGADTFLFRHDQTGFAMELSPRIGFILKPWLDAGLYLGLGYGGPIPEWTQMTTFGVGGFVNASLPLRGRLRFNPWAGVMYHYAFIEGFSEPQPGTSGVIFPNQSVRVDLHGDLSLQVSKFSSMNFGLYCKSRLAPVSNGPGTADQLSYGLRVSAVTAF